MAAYGKRPSNGGPSSSGSRVGRDDGQPKREWWARLRLARVARGLFLAHRAVVFFLHARCCGRAGVNLPAYTHRAPAHYSSHRRPQRQ